MKNLVKPLVLVLPPALLTQAVNRDTMKTQMVDLLGPKIGGFLDESALVLFVGAFLYVTFAKTIYGIVKERAKPAKELNRDELVALLRSISIVVGDKASRFSQAVKEAIQRKWEIKDQEIFQKITQPSQQIGLLVCGLRTIFEEILGKSNASFHVGLVAVEGGKPVDWASFDPLTPGPRVDAKKLDDPECTVYQCIDEKRTIVIEDVAAEAKKRFGKKRFKDFGSKEEGALLCYPLICPTTHQVVFALSVFADRKKVLEEQHKELYEWVIQHFASRILLEHSLLTLKEKKH